jgi:ethanolamine ammonia-lyase small subunit
MSNDSMLVQHNPWDELRVHTAARIALGRVGSSLPTEEVLRFGLAHAQARDAVHRPLDAAQLLNELSVAGFSALDTNSEAQDRQMYLLRPDLGRQLSSAGRELLQQRATAPELTVVIADGLSSVAVQRHAVPLLLGFRKRWDADWENIPVVIVRQGRVAVGDDVGVALRARLVVMLIGERPGLSSPDSLGVYVTFAPRSGCRDNERNCISNVRPEGLGYELAAHKLEFLVRQALRLRLTGVELKDDSDLKLV